MQVGVLLLFDGRPGRTMADCPRAAREVEDMGFSSLWLPDHVVTFDQYAPAYPYSADGQPPFGRRQGWYDPLFGLAAAATATSRLRLGTGVLVLPQRNPVVLAQEVATLDHLSEGRFDLGIGIGWCREEYRALNVPFERRGARTEEYIEAMTILWQEDLASYHGDFVSFRDVVALPKPVQRPRPPIIIGGQSPTALRRAARLGDGWISWELPVKALPGTLQRLETECETIGREPTALRRVIASVYTSPDDLDRYARTALDHGATELVVAPLVRGRDQRDVTEEAARVLGLRS